MQLFEIERELHVLLEQPDFTDDFNQLVKCDSSSFSVEDALTAFCHWFHHMMIENKHLNIPPKSIYNDIEDNIVDIIVNEILIHVGVPADYEDQDNYANWEDIVHARVSQFVNNNLKAFKTLADDIINAIDFLNKTAEICNISLSAIVFFNDVNRPKTIIVGGYYDGISERL